MKNKLNYLLAFLPYLIVFIGSIFSSSDPDLGWHLKNGEYFFKHYQILRDNPYTTMMPSFHWANVSWGTDLITYIVFHFGGFIGLSLLGALIVTFTFYFFSKAAGLKVWNQIFLFPFLLYLENPINNVSFRGQQISLMLLGVLFYLIGRHKKNSKILLFTIPLFLFWVNLHGEFILGLVMFLSWMVVYVGQKVLLDINKNRIVSSFKESLISNENELVLLLIVFFLSTVVTFINPFGIGVHLDALSHVGNPLLKNISEYLPFPALSQSWWDQVTVAVFLFIGITFLYFNDKIFPQIPVLVSVLFLYILSFSVRRFAWPAYYLSLPILALLPEFLKPDQKKTIKISSVFLLAIILIAVVVNNYPFDKYLKYNWDNYCLAENITCSPKSAKFLIEHNLTQDMFSLYGWGGFLIWNYPTIKPTIDGRMHLWKDSSGYSGFSDYYSYEQNYKDITKTNYKVVYISPGIPLYNRMLELMKLGKWKTVYMDKFAGIFVRI